MRFNHLTVFLLFFLYGCETQTIVKEGNLKKIPLEFNFKATKDADCGMTVESLRFAAQVVSKDGTTWFFHDPGGVANFLEKTSVKNPVIWFYTLDSKKWITSDKVWFSLTDETPMEYGFGAYENKQESFIDFKTMRLKMLRGENLTNPLIKKRLLGNS